MAQADTTPFTPDYRLLIILATGGRLGVEAYIQQPEALRSDYTVSRAELLEHAQHGFVAYNYDHWVITLAGAKAAAGYLSAQLAGGHFEALKLLGEAREFVTPLADPTAGAIVRGVYVRPPNEAERLEQQAQALQEEADALRRRDDLAKRIRRFLAKSGSGAP